MATVVSSIEEQKKTIPQNTGNNVDESQALYGAGLPTVDTTPTTTTPEQTGQPLTIKEKSQQVSAQTGSYYTDVYLPKKQAEQQAKTGDISQIETPTPSKASAMTPEMIAVDYTRNNISATELENLKLTDPNKYNLAKAEIERSRTLEAINMTGSQYIEGQQKNLDSYLQKRNEIAGDDEGTKLREEVRAKYNIKGTQDSIAQYKGELEAIDSRMYKMTQEAGSGSAMGNRGEMIMEQRDLMEQRRVAVQGLNAQIDYLKLGLEQADAVVNDYKDYKGQQLDMMQTEFEARTGISKDEYDVKDKQMRDYLTDIDKDILKVEGDIKAEEKQAQDTVLNASLLSLYDNFSEDEKAVLMGLPSESVGVLLKTIDAQAKADAEMKMDIAKMDWEKYKFGIEQDAKNNNYKPVTIEINGKKTTVLVNENGDIKPINNDYLPGSVPTVKNTGDLGGQCGAYVNRTIPGMQPGRKRFGDTLSEKMNLVDSSVPVVGGAVVMDYGQIDPATGKNYGHVGVVTGINADGSINISDSNVNLDGKVSNRTLTPSEMNKIMGYMTPPVQTEAIVDGFSSFKYGLTEPESKTFDSTVQRFIEAGDIDSVKTNLREMYMTRLSMPEQTRIRSREQLAMTTQGFLRDMEAYVANGGDTGFFTGKTQDMLTKIGKTKDPELAVLQTQIIDWIDQIGKDRSGAALTEYEMKLYEQILPGIGKSMSYNRAIVEGIVRNVENQDTYIDSQIERMTTGKAKEFLFPPERDPKDFSTRMSDTKASQYVVD